MHPLDRHDGYIFAQRDPDMYALDLGGFTQLSDEKEIIANYIKSYGPTGTILDIGAGSGDVARFLRDSAIEKNQRYVAVEQNPSLCQQLSDLGVEVVRGTFPDITIDDQFDTVISSHSLPAHPEKYQPFLDCALERVGLAGRLTVILLSDTQTAFASIMNEIGFQRDTRGKYIGAISNYLQARGQVQEKEVISTIRADSLEGIVGAIAFIGSTNGNPEKKRTITNTLFARPNLLDPYLTSHGYSFPISNYGITVTVNDF